jgi:glycosyltransferase involved in cell wall biosynthesis
MRLLLIFQHFFPETGATQNRGMSLAEFFAERGHDVHVIAAKPNHPEGVIWPEYRGTLFTQRKVRGFSVTYTWIFTRPAKSVGNRTVSYLSFMIMAILAGIGLRRRFDVVLASSPPPFLGVSGWILARLTGARLVFDVRDLWPGLAVALGELKNPAAIWLAERLERFLYKRADAITAVTRPFCEEISKIVGAHKPVRLVMNGTTPEFLSSDGSRQVTRSSRGWEGRFVLMYAGNIGVCQGLSHLLGAAKLLEARAPDVLFQIVGNGPRKAQLACEFKDLGLSNLELLDRVPLLDAIALMAGADALVVPLAANEKCEQFIPSKLFDSMAIGRPVLLSVGGEARRILEEADAGIYYPAEDPQALADAIVRLRDDRGLAAKLGANGRQYVERCGLRSQQIEALDTLLRTLANPDALPSNLQI